MEIIFVITSEEENVVRDFCRSCSIFGSRVDCIVFQEVYVTRDPHEGELDLD